jgi:hypothetical protein
MLLCIDEIMPFILPLPTALISINTDMVPAPPLSLQTLLKFPVNVQEPRSEARVIHKMGAWGFFFFFLAFSIHICSSFVHTKPLPLLASCRVSDSLCYNQDVWMETMPVFAKGMGQE